MYHLVTGLYAHYTQAPRYNVLLLGISGSGKTAWLDKVRSIVTKTGSRSLRRFQPTVGQNVLNLKLSRATLHFWDLGGEASLRRLWSRYFDEADVFVWTMNAQDWVDLATDADVENEEDDEEVDYEPKEVRIARRKESWEALASLRSHSHLASLPLLIVITHMDQIDFKRASQFQQRIKPVLQEKFSELAKAEETDLEEEMNQLDDSVEGKQYQKHIWRQWQVITCSAKDGTGCEEFVDWLHSHAKNAQGR